MPRPASKQTLLSANVEAFERLNQLIDSLESIEVEREFPFEHRDRNVRDVLAHLLEWQRMMLSWYQIGIAGGQPQIPARDYTWKMTPELNLQIWKKYQTLPLKAVRSKLRASHNRLQRLVQNHTDKQLFTKRLYPWTGSTSLGVYLTAASWSHYGWALKLLKKFVKQLKTNRQHSVRASALMKPRFFKTARAFRTWLEKYHSTRKELIVGYYKVGTGRPSITWPESVDQALCFGWIDGVRRSLDEHSYTIRFTPRKPKSSWSEVNIRRVAALTSEGLMRPEGLSAFERRSEDKSAIYSYEQRDSNLPEPYAGQLKKSKRATKFFEDQTVSYRKAASWWVISGKKEETRQARLKKLIKLSAQSETIPQFISRNSKNERPKG